MLRPQDTETSPRATHMHRAATRPAQGDTGGTTSACVSRGRPLTLPPGQAGIHYVTPHDGSSQPAAISAPVPGCTAAPLRFGARDHRGQRQRWPRDRVQQRTGSWVPGFIGSSVHWFIGATGRMFLGSYPSGPGFLVAWAHALVVPYAFPVRVRVPACDHFHRHKEPLRSPGQGVWRRKPQDGHDKASKG